MVSSWMLTGVSLRVHTMLWTMVRRPGARLCIHGNSWTSPSSSLLILADISLCPQPVVAFLPQSSHLWLPQALSLPFPFPLFCPKPWPVISQILWSSLPSKCPLLILKIMFSFSRGKRLSGNSFHHLHSPFPFPSLYSWCKCHTEDPAIFFSQALVLLQESYWLREWRWWTFQKSYRQKMIDAFSIPNTHTTLAALQNIITLGLQTDHKDENWNQRTYACTGK